LSTAVAPEGGGTASPKSGMYDEDAELKLNATAALGYTFDCWSGDITSTRQMPTLVMDGDKSITAHFKLYYSPSFSVVSSGMGNPLAASYTGSEHPIILIGSDGNEHEWSLYIPNIWLPVLEEETQLVACVGPEEKKAIETCYYDGPNIVRYQYRVVVRLRAAKTGATVATTTLSGSLPRQCMTEESYWLTELVGSNVSFLQVQEWLEKWVAP